MQSKTTGYILIFIGLIIIIYSAISMVLVFTGVIEPISLYSSESISIDFSSLMPSYTIGNGQIPVKVNSPAPSPQTSQTIAESFNLLIHVFLMGFLVNVGYKIASLGTQLVRPIVVRVKKNEQIISPQQESNHTL